MNLKNLTKLYGVNNVVLKKSEHIGGSSNNLIKWLFAQETESETQTTAEPAEITPVNVVPLEIPPLQPVLPVPHETPVPKETIKKHLMVIFVGLPKCGKTQMSIEILKMLKINNLRTKFVETQVGPDDFKTRIYYDKIRKHVGTNVDVIICNGDNYKKETRETVMSIGKENKFDILFVDFKHSGDSDKSYRNYQDFCTKAIKSRTDMVALNTDLNRALSEYNELTQEELDLNNYLKVYINHNRQTNINNIVIKIKEILGI